MLLLYASERFISKRKGEGDVSFDFRSDTPVCNANPQARFADDVTIKSKECMMLWTTCLRNSFIDHKKIATKRNQKLSLSSE
jgi:hypothetical protein